MLLDVDRLSLRWLRWSGLLDIDGLSDWRRWWRLNVDRSRWWGRSADGTSRRGSTNRGWVDPFCPECFIVFFGRRRRWVVDGFFKAVGGCFYEGVSVGDWRREAGRDILGPL